MQYTAGSLFSGIGLIDYAFAKAGFDVRFQVEIEPFCQKVLTKHAPEYWPNARIFDDIKTVRADQLYPVDVLFGGFPCQDISAAGRGKGIKEGTRSGLWFEFARLIGDLRPRYVFIENVPPITVNGGTTVIGALTAMGYDCQWGIVAAADVGAPHRRERWFCVAYHARWGSDSRWAEQPGQERTPAPFEHGGVAYAQCTERRSAGVQTGNVDHGNHGIPEREETASRPGVGNREVGDTNSQSKRYGYDGALAILPNGAPKNEGERESVPDKDEGNVKSRLGGIFDGLPARVDAIRRQSRWPSRPNEAQHFWEPARTARGVPGRVARLKALGNAVVWQAVFPFAQGIWEALVAEDSDKQVTFNSSKE